MTLKPGTRVVLTEHNGRKTTGRVAEVTPTAIELSLSKGADGNRPSYQPGRSEHLTFTEGDVAEIRKTDGLQNGLWIGLAAGAAIGVLAGQASAYDNSQVDDAVATAFTMIGVGALTGVLIDATTVRGPVVYRARAATGRISAAPLLRKGGRGVLVSMRF